MTSIQSRPAFSFEDLASTLQSNGLEILGTFQPDEGEVLVADRAVQPRTIAIVGNVGSDVWPHYDGARQDRPDLTLDRWTEDVVGKIAATFGLDALYPFQGPPYHPFIRWAKRTGTLFQSPIGLTIHPTYGLWLAFRAALLIDAPLEKIENLIPGHGPKVSPVPGRHPGVRPCDDCVDRPCLSACPVSAFTGERYDFEACIDHLATPANDCRGGGCLARIACPVGRDHRYEKPHASFHMEQLLRAHGRS